MKKLAIAAALAAMATTVSAQNVEVYGKMRIYMEKDEVGTASSVTKQSNDSSRLGFRGTENLGGGLKAFFTLETGVGADQPGATTLGDRTSVVGLSTDLWSVGLGRDKHQVTRVIDAFDPLENSFGTTTGTIHQAHGSRFQNAAFVSVTPIKGITGHYQRSESEVSGTKAVQAYGLNANLGPIAAAVARYDNGLDGANENSSTIVGGKVALGSAGTTVFGIYSEDTLAGAKTEGKTVGVQQKLGGPLTVLASYGTKQGVDAYAVGATYNLSKRTFLHARYRNENSDVAANDRKQFGVGIEHNF
jgi:predicted porin